MDWGGLRSKQRLQFLTPELKSIVPQVPIAQAKQVEKHDRRRNLVRKKSHPRGGRVNSELQSFEVEAATSGNDDFAIEHAAFGQLCSQRVEQFRKIAVQ